MKVPNHAAVIMDGNRRWAKRRDLPVWKGHEKGRETVEDMLDYFLEEDIENTSLYILSNDNYKERKEKNIEKLLDIQHDAFKELLDDGKLDKYKVNVRFVGKWWEVDNPSLRETIRKLMEETKQYGKRSLNLVFNYVTKFIPSSEDYRRQLKQEEKLTDMDLLVRTGNRKRISSFLPTKLRYCEIYFEEKMYPATNRKDWRKWLEWFSGRERNFGK